jgi:ATP-dependent exoDNAse (exonuclease V) beta subunit
MKAIEAARDGEIPESKHEREGFDLACAALARDYEKGWNLLACPGRLKVQTIDALCAALTRQMPILSGLGRLPAITEDPTALYREAARRTIALMEKEGAEGHTLRQALRHLDNNFAALEKRLIAMLARRDQWLRHIKLKDNCSEEDLRGHLEKSLRRSIERTLKQLQAAFPEDLLKEALSCGHYAASNLAGDDIESPVRVLAEQGEAGITYNYLPLWRGLGALLLTGKREWRKTGGVNKKIGFPADKAPEALEMKERFKSLLVGLAEQERLEKVLAEVALLPDGRYEDREWIILNDLLRLLPLAQRSLQSLFGEEGLVDFQAVSMAAISALGEPSEPTDLMLALDLRLIHILVDEYQDTSQLQLKLLEALSAGWEAGDGRTLFVVGDPMQSIYLFREAEVGLFLQAESEGIGSVKLESLKLKSNFRSQAGIIDWANSIFHAAFPGEGDQLLGAIPYSPFSPVLLALEGDAVRLFTYEARDDELEAEHIVHNIRSIRKMSPDQTVVVLARSRTHLTKLIELIKNEGIDFRTIGLDPLIERPVIQDLLSLLRAMMHPCDRTAWLAILRAPWCGLTMPDIHRLVNGEKKIIWEVMGDENHRQLLSEDARQRLGKLCEKLSPAIALWGRKSPRTLLEGLWISIGGPACIDADSIEDADAFFDMLEAATVSGRLEAIDILEERITKLHANHGGEGDNPVDIMTIHRSKGLEFDHVIIPGLGKPPSSGEKRLIYAMESGEDLFLAPIEETGKNTEGAIYKYLSRIGGKKELLEQVRLLYVAATRAKKRLYLFGHVRGLKDDLPSIDKHSFLASISQLVNPASLIDVDSGDEKDEAGDHLKRSVLREQKAG